MYCILCQAKLLKNKEPHNSYVLLHFSNCYFITVPLMKIKPGTSVYNYAYQWLFKIHFFTTQTYSSFWGDKTSYMKSTKVQNPRRNTAVYILRTMPMRVRGNWARLRTRVAPRVECARGRRQGGLVRNYTHAHYL